jgi:hypothetical protein
MEEVVWESMTDLGVAAHAKVVVGAPHSHSASLVSLHFSMSACVRLRILLGDAMAWRGETSSRNRDWLHSNHTGSRC